MPRNTTLYKIAGPETFRLSSKTLFARKSSSFGPAFDGYGTNLQNIEKYIRAIYIPDKGKLFLQRDQSGAEALIVAYLCKPGRFRDLFIYGVKPHVFVALHLFKEQFIEKEPSLKDVIYKATKTEIKELGNLNKWNEVDFLIKDSDNWSSKERYYFIAKAACYLANYEGHGHALRLSILEKSEGAIVLTDKEGEEYLQFYRTLFPEIVNWRYGIDQKVRVSKVLYNLFGHPREFTQNLKDNFRDCYAFIPQSTVGVITHIAITKMQQYIEEHNLDWDILQNNHDSFLVQSPILEWRHCAEKMKEFIEIDLISPYDKTPFKMRSGLTIGKNWGPYHETKNPCGLIEI